MKAKEEKEVRAKIEAAIYKLQLLPDSQKEVQSSVNKIMIYAKLREINQSRQAKECSQAQSDKEIKKLIEMCAKLRKHIRTLHRTSLKKFENNRENFTNYHPFMLENELNGVITAAKMKPEKISTHQTKRGRPESIKARGLTDDLGEIYTALTGRRAVRHNKEGKLVGAYAVFTTDVFKALKIKESSTSQVVTRSRRMYKKSEKISN